MLQENNQENKQTITGSVQKITYRNEINCYTVAEIKLPREIITAVGIMPYVSEGDYVDLVGNFTVHQTYGQQFNVESFEKRIR